MTTLPTAVLTKQKLERLTQIGFSVEEVARAGAVTESAVYARRKTPSQRRTAFDQRIDDLYDICTFLTEEGLDDAMVRGWLVSRSRHLDGAVPIEAIADGSHAAVFRAAQGFMSGLPASEWRRLQELEVRTEEEAALAPIHELARGNG